MQRFFSTLAMVITGGVLLAAAVPMAAQAKQPEHAGQKSEDRSRGNDHDKGHDKGHEKGHEKGHGQDTQRDDRDHTRWQSEEASIIKGFFSAYWADGTPRGKAMPPGLAKQGKIPPGIAMQIQEGKRLPDGVGRALPPLLVAQLPQRVGVRSVLVGDDLVLVDAVSQVIVDILRGVAR